MKYFILLTLICCTHVLAFGRNVTLSTYTVKVGEVITVKWSGFTGNVNVEFYKGTSFIVYANTNLAGTGQQDLTMTDAALNNKYHLTAGNNYNVVVKLRSDTTVLSKSDDFTLYDPKVSISPSSVDYDGYVTLNWSGFLGNVNLSFYKGNEFISNPNIDVAGTGDQKLIMTDADVSKNNYHLSQGSDYNVKVELKSNPQINSTSNSFTVNVIPTIQYGSVNVSLSPANAVNSGAKWNIDNSTWQNSGNTLYNITPGNHIIYFQDISGWNAPSSKNIVINANQTTNENGEYSQTPFLSISQTSQPVSSNAGEQSLNVSSNISWSAKSDQNWLTIISTNNNTINYSYSSNPNTYSRTATITVSGISVSNQVLTVTQAGQGASITFEPSKIEAKATLDNYSVKINSNVDWTAATTDKWLKIFPAVGTANSLLEPKITVDENKTNESRTGYITFANANNGTSVTTLEVKQISNNQIIFSLDPNSISHLRWPFPESSWSNRNGWNGGDEVGGTGCGPHDPDYRCSGHFGSNYWAVDWNGDNDCNKVFYSPVSGTVIRSNKPNYEYCGNNVTDNKGSGYGGEVIIQCSDNPSMFFRVAHLNKVIGREIKSVNIGDYLGQIGSTGASTGAHAHCALYKNANSTLNFKNETNAAQFKFDAVSGGENQGSGGDGENVLSFVDWVPKSPTNKDTITIVYRDAGENNGTLIWGVNNWNKPLGYYVTNETSFVGTNAESNMILNDSLYIKIGPFNNTNQKVENVNLMIRFQDGSLENNSGKNYTINITNPLPTFSSHVWHISKTGDNTTGNGTINNPFATIQFGIERAAVGDTVLVNEGTFNENIDFMGKDIVVASYYLFNPDASTIDKTIIKGTDGSVVKIANHESNKAILNGFTITGGVKTANENDSGGGIFMWSSFAKLMNLKITDNRANYGGGISLSEANPYLYNVQVFNNTAIIASGGINCNGSSPAILNSYIHDNNAPNSGGLNFFDQSNAIVVNCLVIGNKAGSVGGGININGSDPKIINTTIVNNTGWGSGLHSYNSSPTITNSIIWNNDVIKEEGTGNITITYSNISNGWSGIGNINAAPEFTDSTSGDFSLKGISPCINTGIPDTTGLKIGLKDYSGNPRIYGSMIDMGAYEYQSSPLPGNAGPITGKAIVCQGQNDVSYSIPSVTNATSYIWTLPIGATGTSTTNEITVNYGALAQSGNISVKGKNYSGEGDVSNLSIVVYAIPGTPTVIQNEEVLNSNALNGNQWYNTSGLINGATNQDYSPKSSGDYYVIVSVNGCASNSSNSFHFIPTGIDPMVLKNSIKVYPNPVTDELIIEFEGNTNMTDFEIVNSIGQVVFSGVLFEKTAIKTSSFIPGMYLIKLESGKTFEFKKVVKK